jgi:hypothetical protein
MQAISHSTTRLRACIAVGAALLAGALLPSPAQAGSGPLSFTVLGAAASTPGSDWGALMPPTSVTFSDNFTANTGTGPVAIVDDWTFSVPSSVFTNTTVTGEQINFSNFTLSGTVDTVGIYSGSAGSGTLLKSWTPAGVGSYSGVVNYELTSAGSYYIQVSATQNVNTVGGYSGVFVAAVVPEPVSWVLTAAGLAALGFGIALRRR